MEIMSSHLTDFSSYSTDPGMKPQQSKTQPWIYIDKEDEI